MKYFWRYNSLLGEIFMQSDGVNLTALKFGKFSEFGSEFREQNLQIFKDTSAWLDIYFSGISPNFTPKISLIGSEFQLEIWEILMQIPFGATTTYGEIAHEIALKRQIPKMSARSRRQSSGSKSNCDNYPMPQSYRQWRQTHRLRIRTG